MTASTVHDTSDHSDFAYELACRLIETELGGCIISSPAEPGGHSAECARQPYLVDRDTTVEV
ncbi:hypothetical protein [Amycolatopsis nalaikhensis]|uniref:Uncharacterized protein n=1 Tax=Amycolatopsis nalaikhensis TaxID=715472 RepID=A0ABY8XYB9_9PSEU|nr:hypothetical protein [Amycolatopsis sp. 2-2]WIV60651.1 hypothetical protein QP939_19595 [Amycolatopsis sp. 2-2]